MSGSATWCQWVPRGRRRAVKWILRTCWLKKDLLQPLSLFLASRLGLGSDFLADFLPPADNTHSLLVTALLVKFHVLLQVHTCYSDCHRSHWEACRPCRQHHAGPPWPHQSSMFPSQVILAPMVKPVSVFNAISHLRIVWFSVCFHFSGPFNDLYISCTFVLSSLYRIKNNIKIRVLKYNLISYHKNLCKLCHQHLFRHHMKKILMKKTCKM